MKTACCPPAPASAVWKLGRLEQAPLTQYGQGEKMASQGWVWERRQRDEMSGGGLVGDTGFWWWMRNSVGVESGPEAGDKL